MTDQSEDGRRFLKTLFAVVGIASFLCLVIMVVAGMEKVNTGTTPTMKSTWLVEVNGLAFVVLAAAVVFSATGVGVIHWREWRALKRRE